MQGEHRIRPGEDHQPQTPTAVPEHELEVLRDVRIHELVAVQDQGERLRQVGERGTDVHEHPTVARSRGGRAVGDGHPVPAQAVDHDRPEGAGTVIPRLAGDPGDDADGRRRAAQAATRVVFPVPAGALTSVSG